MHNFPNITSAEVAVVCTAALLLCIVPNLMAWGDARRQRRLRRAALAQTTMMRGSLEASASTTMLGVPASAEPAARHDDATGVVLEAPPPVAPVTETVFAPAIDRTAVSAESLAPSTDAAIVTSAPADEEAIHDFRLDELRRVKLPNWPPPEVRDNPEKKRIWEEAVRIAEQPLITSMRLRSPRRAESACLCAADSEGSVLRLRFLLFPELWPVAADQATAAVTFEIDSASGEVHSSVRSL